MKKIVSQFLDRRHKYDTDIFVVKRIIDKFGEISLQ